MPLTSNRRRLQFEARVVLLIALCCSRATGVAVRHVPAEYGTIQAALNAAQPGDTVSVAAGVYSETVSVRVGQITLAGSGSAMTTIRGKLSVEGPYADVVVRDLGISVGNPDGLVVGGGATVTVRDVAVADCAGNGVDCWRDGAESLVRLSRTSVTRCARGLLLWAGSAVVEQCSFVHNSEGLSAWVGGQLTLDDSKVTDTAEWVVVAASPESRVTVQGTGFERNPRPSVLVHQGASADVSDCDFDGAALSCGDGVVRFAGNRVVAGEVGVQAGAGASLEAEANTIAGCTACGVGVWDGQPAPSVVLRDNVFTNCATAAMAYGGSVEATDNSVSGGSHGLAGSGSARLNLQRNQLVDVAGWAVFVLGQGVSLCAVDNQFARSGQAAVAVMNGATAEVRGSLVQGGGGIHVSNGPALVSGNRLVGTTFGLDVGDNGRLTAAGNTVADCTGAALSCWSTGPPPVLRATDTTATRCVVAVAAWAGQVEVTSSSFERNGQGLVAGLTGRLEATGNRVTGSGGWGMQVNGPSAALVASGNTIEQSAWQGVLVTSGARGELAGNAIAGSGSDGVRFDGGLGHAIGNHIWSNNGAGVAVLGTGQARLSRNSIHDNAGLGIDLGGDGVTPGEPGGSGPNHAMPMPVLTVLGVDAAAVRLGGSALPGSVVEVFVAAPDPSGHGEGKELLDSVTADGSGQFALTVSRSAMPVTATATDAVGNTSEFSVLISNLPPCADAGPDQTVEASGPAGALVRLDGSASVDPDGDALTFTWHEAGAVLAGPSTQPTAAVLLPLGEHLLDLTVEDRRGGTASDTLLVTVVDTTPPELLLGTSITSLWPPNNKLVDVGLLLAVQDLVDPRPAVNLAITQDEPASGHGSEDGDDARIVRDAVGRIVGLWLRASRAGRGDGRVYLLQATATDCHGNSRRAAWAVTVPKSQSAADRRAAQRQAEAAVAAGVPLAFDSIGGGR